MTPFQRRQRFYVIKGDRADSGLIDLAFAPVWFWLAMMGIGKWNI